MTFSVVIPFSVMPQYASHEVDLQVGDIFEIIKIQSDFYVHCIYVSGQQPRSNYHFETKVEIINFCCQQLEEE